ncbi:hypothetical protein ACOCJ5_04060 [Knoellia sp. CPCC 206450]|uniref:hypothetical protein n=1 Tax=Knoellia tibetensis TaxID=3404798 RepID=UPI003B42D51A
MKYLIVGIIIVIALLVIVLNRRGATNLGSNGSTDTEAGALGQQTHHNHPGSGGTGAP